MRSESYTFIWQPYVLMKRRFGSGLEVSEVIGGLMTQNRVSGQCWC
jgi:hypothetical protein